MSVSSRVGAALAAGYVLGRFKKLRFALVVGSALANKNVRDSAMSFVSQGTKGLASSPEAQKIAKQITTELADAGKAAAMTAVSGRINQLSDQLSQRSASLMGEKGKAEQEPGEQEEAEQEQPQEEGEAQERGQESREQKPRDREPESGDESEEGEAEEYEGEESEGEEGEEPEDEAEDYEGEETEGEEGEEPEDEAEDYEGEETEGEESGESEDEGGEATDEYEDEEGGEGESDRDVQAARAVPRRQRAASPAARKGA